jgi:hypothetical protein
MGQDLLRMHAFIAAITLDELRVAFGRTARAELGELQVHALHLHQPTKKNKVRWVHLSENLSPRLSRNSSPRT